MNDDLDLKRRLAEIPDPFAGARASTGVQPFTRPLARSPARSRVAMRRLFAVVTAVVYDAGWVVWVRRRPDLASLPPLRVAGSLLIPLAAVVLAWSIVVRAGQRGLGERKERLATAVVLAPLLFMTATLATAPEGPTPEFWRHTTACMFSAAILSVGPLALGLWAFRRAFAVVSAWRTAALGVASGGLAAATLSLACPISTEWHVIVGHGSMMLVVGVLAATLGPRICRA